MDEKMIYKIINNKWYADSRPMFLAPKRHLRILSDYVEWIARKYGYPKLENMKVTDKCKQ